MRWESPVSAGGPQTPHIPGPEGRFCTFRAQDGRRDPPVCTVNALCGRITWSERPRVGRVGQKAVRAIRLRCAPDCSMFLRTQVCYKTYRSTCTAQQKLRVLLFYAVGIAGIGGGSADAPYPGAGGALLHPARRPFSRAAPAPEKWIKCCSDRRPPCGWHTPGRPRPRPGFPGRGPKVFPPVSSPGGWLWCSPHVIWGRRCSPPR